MSFVSKVTIGKHKATITLHTKVNIWQWNEEDALVHRYIRQYEQSSTSKFTSNRESRLI